MTALAEIPAGGEVKRLGQQRERELYARALFALARKGGVPGVALGHLAVRVLLFLLGQKPGYFGHQKVIATALESNVSSVQRALVALRDARLVAWELIPPHHALPTGKYTRTNVNMYFVEANAIVVALDGDSVPGASRTVTSTQSNLTGSTGTNPKFGQDPPLPPRESVEPQRDREPTERESRLVSVRGTPS